MLRFTDTITTPPGGFQYEDKDTGFKVKTRSWKDCKAAVWKYRVANGGDVAPYWEFRLQEEMILQNNLQGTDWAVDDERYFPPAGEGISAGDIFRALSSFGKIIASGVVLMDKTEAERRAAICTDCEFNQPIQSCLGCNGISALVKAVRGVRETTQDNKLNGCQKCHCPLKVKVWLPLSSIDNRGVDYPPWCWQASTCSDASKQE